MESAERFEIFENVAFVCTPLNGVKGGRPLSPPRHAVLPVDNFSPPNQSAFLNSPMACPSPLIDERRTKHEQARTFSLTNSVRSVVKRTVALC